jgi:endopolyphosphatase
MRCAVLAVLGAALSVVGGGGGSARAAQQVPLAAASPAAPPSAASIDAEALQPRLHGRFLHLTDLHPDPFYRTGARVAEACHVDAAGKMRVRKDKRGGGEREDERRAGYWGTAKRCVFEAGPLPKRGQGRRSKVRGRQRGERRARDTGGAA